MTPESNTISIIVPMYNAAQTIDRCVASVFSQRFPDMELLLIDDGSTDDTLARCETLAAGRPDVRVIARPRATRGWTRRGANGSCFWTRTTASRSARSACSPPIWGRRPTRYMA